MKRKNLFLFLSRNKRNYQVGINRGSYIVIFGAVFIVAHRQPVAPKIETAPIYKKYARIPPSLLGG
jgi:hypothetical protein